MAEALKRKRRYQKRVLGSVDWLSTWLICHIPQHVQASTSVPLNPAIHVLITDMVKRRGCECHQHFGPRKCVLYMDDWAEYSCIRFLAESASCTSISGRFKVLV